MSTYIYPAVTVNTAGLATEAKQDSIISELQDQEVLLTSLDGKDFATETTLAALNNQDFATETTLAALDAKVTAVNTGDVTVSSSALPTGAATESTLNTVAGDTTSLDNKTPALGSALTAASVPVNIASDQTVPVSASSLPLPTGAATESTLSTVAGDTTSLDSKLPSQGAALTAASLPVNIASDQTVPVSASSLPLPTGAATESTLSDILNDTNGIESNSISIASNTSNSASSLSSIDGKITAVNTGDVTVSSSALPTGAATAANQSTIISELQGIGSKTPVDFLDSGVVDSNSSNITTAGLTVVASLAANVSELEIVEDIGEFMALTDGSDTVLAYLPLGGGRVKVSISSGTALKLRSLTGSAISLGSIAINFLG